MSTIKSLGIYVQHRIDDDVAALNNVRDRLAKKRASCDRLHNGSCSPCKFDCPLYRNGKCIDPMKEDV